MLDLNKIKDKNILIISDVCLDIYEYYNSNEISPEFPVPKAILKSKEILLGMGSNIALNIKTLGGNPILISNWNVEFEKQIEKYDITNRFFLTENVTYKKRILVNSKHIIRIDKDVDFNEPTFIDWFKFKISLLKNIDGIIISDYNRGIVKNFGNEIIKILRKEFPNVKILFDPHKNNKNIIDCDYFIPNWIESNILLDLKLDKNIENIKLVLEKLENKFKLPTILKLSELGLCYHTILKLSELSYNKYRFIHLPAYKNLMIDACGCGDSLISTLSLSLATGLNLHKSIELANIAAGIAVCKQGTKPVMFEELKKEYEEFYNG